MFKIPSFTLKNTRTPFPIKKGCKNSLFYRPQKRTAVTTAVLSFAKTVLLDYTQNTQFCQVHFHFLETFAKKEPIFESVPFFESLFLGKLKHQTGLGFGQSQLFAFHLIGILGFDRHTCNRLGQGQFVPVGLIGEIG